MKKRPTSRPRDATGSVMLEFVIAFPVMLVLFFFCIQLALLWIGKQVVHYAAFCAARAGLVTVCHTEGPSGTHESWPRREQLGYRGFDFAAKRSIAGRRGGYAQSEAEWAGCQAAARVCSLLAGDAATNKTRTIVTFDPATWNVRATTEHDFALTVPIVGAIIAWGMNPWDQQRPWATRDSDATGNAWPVFPHIRLTETILLPKPYHTIIAAGNWRTTGMW